MNKLTATLCSGLFLLTLSACGGGGNATVTCANQYWDGTVGTCLPSGWHVVDRTQLDSRGIPQEVVVAFQSDNPVAGQFVTVTVTSEPLNKQMTSSDYSDASIQSVQAMPNYTKVDAQSVTIDGQKVTMNIFTAQPRSDQPKTRFYQVSAVNGMTGYTYTAATPVSVDTTTEQQVELILKNATFKAPSQK
ncbi:MAG TPA: hypothetical protein VHA78_04325 [Candidatus Peribacteraceae bacterium]|nr:hypothetical protein [Candidatus Peribacteraceae bacterium]